MTTTVLWGLVLLTGCSSPEPETFNATLTFTLARPGDGGPEVLAKPAMVHLVAAKPGRKSLIDGWADDAGGAEQYGRHNFPPGSTASGIASYYAALLANAGWMEGEDFRPDVENAAITFIAVATLRAGADSVSVVTMLTRLSTSPTETR